MSFFLKMKLSILKNIDQLDKLKDAITEKQPKLANGRGHHKILYNTKSHVALIVRKKLL